MLLVLVVIMVLVIRCTRRKRRYTVAQKRHKELKHGVKEWERSMEENDYKDRIYDLPIQPKKQPRVKRLDSTA